MTVQSDQAVSPVNVLLVDDDKRVHDQFHAAFKQNYNGRQYITIHSANDYSEAVKIVKDLQQRDIRLNLIVTDIHYQGDGVNHLFAGAESLLNFREKNIWIYTTPFILLADQKSRFEDMRGCLGKISKGALSKKKELREKIAAFLNAGVIHTSIQISSDIIVGISNLSSGMPKKIPFAANTL